MASTTTALDVARSALLDVGADVSGVVAVRWVNNRYKELTNNVKMRHLRRVGEIVVPASVTAGTASVTRGSKIVTGDVTAAAAWSAKQNKWYFRADVVWYEVDRVEGSNLYLTSEYAEDTNAAATYDLVMRFVSLPSGLSAADPVIGHPRTGKVLERYSLQELNVSAPSREIVTDAPRVWAEATPDIASEARRIEIYPYPSTNAELFTYVYWVRPPELRADTLIPSDLDPHTLKQGVLVDVMRWMMGKKTREGDVNAAALFRNDYRAQETSWRRAMSEAARLERSSDDISIVLRSNGTDIDYDKIPTAYGHVWRL